MTEQRDLRCPRCGKKLGEALEGMYENTCPRCKRRIVIVRRGQVDILSKAV